MNPTIASAEKADAQERDRGTVVLALNIISYGVLVATEEQNGRKFERLRLTQGIYFGETGLLTGQPLNGDISALTKAVIYEISKDALLPLLKAGPAMADELSELLASRQLARRTVLDQLQGNDTLPEASQVELPSLHAGPALDQRPLVTDASEHALDRLADPHLHPSIFASTGPRRQVTEGSGSLLDRIVYIR